MRWLWYLCLIASLIALGGCTSDGSSKPEASVSPAASPALPDDWRWESYLGVEVGVPGDWGWGNGSQRIGQRCINEKDPKPIVGRSGISTLVGCKPAKAGEPDPETLSKNTGWIVSFDSFTYPDGSKNPIARGGDRALVRVGDVVVVIQAPKALRTKIAATAHEVKTDHAGCPVSDPVSLDPSRRPSPASDVTELRGVTSLSVCKYALAEENGQDEKPSLLASARLDGSDAANVIDQIAKAPEGGGPNSPETCVESYGDEIIVLKVTSSRGASVVHVRYSSCDHNGFDDGTAVRTLTRVPVQALIAGPNAVSSWSGVLDPILTPRS